MYKCKICNREFELQRKDHYIARDNGKTGLSALAGGSEEELYDAFDCPHCGCQNITQKRKRDYVPRFVLEETEEEYSNENDWLAEREDDATVAAEKVYTGMYTAERSKCFGQYEGTVDCVTCDEEKECIAETQCSESANAGNVDIVADEDEDDWDA